VARGGKATPLAVCPTLHAVKGCWRQRLDHATMANYKGFMFMDKAVGISTGSRFRQLEDAVKPKGSTLSLFEGLSECVDTGDRDSPAQIKTFRVVAKEIVLPRIFQYFFSRSASLVCFCGRCRS